jgi:hypothetical protein
MCQLPIHEVHHYRADCMLRQFRQEATREAVLASKQVKQRRAFPKDKLKRLCQSIINSRVCEVDHGTHGGLINARCSCLHAKEIFIPLPTDPIPFETPAAATPVVAE